MNLAPNLTVDLIERAERAASPAEVGRMFFDALKPFGIRALYARAHVSTHPDQEFGFSRISPPGWEDTYAAAELSRFNFLPREVRRRGRAFAWSQGARPDSLDQALFPFLTEFAISDGLAAPVHAPGGYVGVTSLAFERLTALSPSEQTAINTAALMLHLKMRELAPAPAVAGPKLTPRERDCLGLVAAGQGDWEISLTLGVAETTVVTHLQNARRKLGARTRAQAVALALMAGLI